MDGIFRVSVYVEQSVKGLKRENGVYGYVVEYEAKGKVYTREGFGEVEHATAHETELIAIREALKVLNRKCIVTIYSGHRFFKNAMLNHWVDEWRGNGWKNARGKDVMNLKSWKLLNEELMKHAIVVASSDFYSYKMWLENEVMRRQQGIKEREKAIEKCV